MTLYPAGHCLGSAQALVESKETGERLLYTGDIKSRTSPTNEPLEVVPCDTLVIEATYGKPEYVFPPQQQVLETAFKTLESGLEPAGTVPRCFPSSLLAECRTLLVGVVVGRRQEQFPVISQ